MENLVPQNAQTQVLIFPPPSDLQFQAQRPDHYHRSSSSKSTSTWRGLLGSFRSLLRSSSSSGQCASDTNSLASNSSASNSTSTTGFGLSFFRRLQLLASPPRQQAPRPARRAQNSQARSTRLTGGSAFNVDAAQFAQESTEVALARALLAKAAELPLSRRQHLLEAAARLPEFAALFTPDGTHPRPHAGGPGTGKQGRPHRDEQALHAAQARLQVLMAQLATADRQPPRKDVGDVAGVVDKRGKGEAADAKTRDGLDLDDVAPSAASSSFTSASAARRSNASAASSPSAASRQQQQHQSSPRSEASLPPPKEVVAPQPPLPQSEGAEAAAAPPVGEEGAQVDALKISVVPEYERYGMKDEEVVRAVVSLKAIPDVRQRARVSLTVSLDRSGSMSGRLGLVQQTTHFLIDQLGPGDCLGLVSYATATRTDMPLLHMTAEGRALAHCVVEALRAGGSTALYDGLAEGVRQQMAAEAEEKEENERAEGERREEGGGAVVHSCFLFTDGQATDGPTSTRDIITGLAALQAPTRQLVTVHTFGFGADHSVDLLRGVAEAQAGVYYYISSIEDVAGGFGDALGGLLAVVAKDIRVVVRPTASATLAAFRAGGRAIGAAAPLATTANIRLPTSRRIQRPFDTATAGNGANGGAGRSPAGITAATTAAAVGAAAAAAPVVVPAGTTFNDMFAEESRECLLVLSLPATPHVVPQQQQQEAGEEEQGSFQTLAEVDMQYTDVATGQHVCRTAVLRVLRSSAAAAQDRPAGQQGPLPQDASQQPQQQQQPVLPNELVFVTAARFETLDAIEEAQRLAAEGDGSDVTASHAVLDRLLQRLRAAPLLLPSSGEEGQGAGERRQVPQLEALLAQIGEARESIKPRSQYDQASAAAVASAVQALRHQRVGTSTRKCSTAFQDQYDLKCKKVFRGTAISSVLAGINGSAKEAAAMMRSQQDWRKP